MANPVLGSGLRYPLTVENGKTVVADSISKVNMSIQTILDTRPGERVHNPEFGSRIWDLVFEPLDDTTKDQLYLYTVEALERWEKRIKIINVFFEEMAEWQGYWMRLEYQIRGTSITGNFVYPFVSEPMKVDDFYTPRVHTDLYGGSRA